MRTSQAYVTGYIIGNEGLSDTGVSLCNPTERICYTLTQLQDAVSYLRAQTNNSKPITTSEQWEDYLQGGNAALMRGLGDWMMPIVHPYNQVPRISDPSAAVQWTLARYNQFVNAAPGRAILFKEVGLPSAGASNVSEAGQESYYRQLKSTAVLFAYFEAFNQPFKYAPDKPVEAHWGIFRETRAPKRVTSHVCNPELSVFNVNQPILSWGYVSWAVQYEVQLDITSTFLNPQKPECVKGLQQLQ
jgi:exo-beta-1,3-glucanase (GH17 family)